MSLNDRLREAGAFDRQEITLEELEPLREWLTRNQDDLDPDVKNALYKLLHNEICRGL